MLLREREIWCSGEECLFCRAKDLSHQERIVCSVENEILAFVPDCRLYPLLSWNKMVCMF